MAITDSILQYRRCLKRRNYSPHTIRSYMNNLKQFIMWVRVPVESVTYKEVLGYMDYLYNKRLGPKTMNCHLNTLREFYNYLKYEEQVQMENPVKSGTMARVPEPLPKYLKDEEVDRLFKVIKNKRDRAMFMLMLRCGLRVEEVANLTLRSIDLIRSQIFIFKGKGAKGRVVYISNDAHEAISDYLKSRKLSNAKEVFLVEKGVYKEKGISVRGIQKRMEYYAQKVGLHVSCHRLRHTMATQLLNADADLVVIQDLLGHTRLKTTQRYCKVSNLKVQRDYHKAMKVVMQRVSS